MDSDLFLTLCESDAHQSSQILNVDLLSGVKVDIFESFQIQTSKFYSTLIFQVDFL